MNQDDEKKEEAVTACGSKLKDLNNYPSAIYGSKRIYFCLRACLRVFESDPDRFMAGEIEHPTKDE